METRIVPNSASYNTVAKYNNAATVILYTSTFISIAITFLTRCKKIDDDIQTVLIALNSLLISLFIFLDLRANYIFTRAEMNRRLDWLDNSFGTNFLGKKSQGYFTNEHLSPGLYKLAVNCFENSYHTAFIVSKMLAGAILQTILITLLFFASAYWGEREVIRLFFELLLPAVLFQKLIKVTIYSSRISEVHNRLKTLFNDLMQHEFDGKTAEAIRDIIEYETALSWASTPLSSRVFFKHKEELAKDWDELKKNYKITT